MEDKIVKVNLTAIEEYFKAEGTLDFPMYKAIRWFISFGNDVAEGRINLEEYLKKVKKVEIHHEKSINPSD